MSVAPYIALRGIDKSFGSTRALANADFECSRGEIVALVGENGAGKSTLTRIAAGLVARDAGVIALEGREQTAWTPAGAAGHGVDMVQQHFALVPEFTIAENIALAAIDAPWKLSPRSLQERAEAAVRSSGIELRGVGRRVEELSVGEQSKLELVKAISRKPSILILDEPTAVLTPTESEQLFAAIRDLASRGIGVVLITHKLREVFSVAERIVVMRAGEVVMCAARGTTSPEEVRRAMFDLPQESPAAAARAKGDTLLQLIDVQSESRTSGIPLRSVSLQVRAGEVVCVIGVAGNGQAELAELLRGLREKTTGTLSLFGRNVEARDLFEASGVAHVPADRTRDGFIAEMSIAENIALRKARWRRRDAEKSASELISQFSIRARLPREQAGNLSGGNQQKMILARELSRDPRLVVASEPTRGLDEASAQFVHRQLRAVTERGAGVLVFTSDLDEAFTIADGIVVMDRGRTSEVMSTETAMRNAAAMMSASR